MVTVKTTSYLITLGDSIKVDCLKVKNRRSHGKDDDVQS